MIPDDEVELPADVIPDTEVEVDVGDIGPPLSAASPPEEFHPGAAGSAAVGFVETAPGLAPAAAALSSAYKSLGTRETLLNNYQSERKRISQLAAAGARDHPVAYYGGGVLPGAVATAIAAGEVVPAQIAKYFAGGKVLPHVGRILGNAALSVADNASDGTLSAGKVGEDVLKAEALNLMLKGAYKPINNLAKGSQLPDKAAKWALGKLGRTKAGEMAAGVDDASDFSSRLSRAVRRGEAELPKEGGFIVSAKDFGDDVAQRSMGAKDKVLKKSFPDLVDDADPFAKINDRIDDFLEKANNARKNASMYSNGKQFLDEAKAYDDAAAALSAQAKNVAAETADRRTKDLGKVVSSAKNKLRTGPTAEDVGKRAVVKQLGAAGVPVAAALKGAEKIGDIGKRIEAIKPLLDSLSQREDAIGRMAKTVLTSGNREALARLATLVESPEESRTPTQ